MHGCPHSLNLLSLHWSRMGVFRMCRISWPLRAALCSLVLLCVLPARAQDDLVRGFQNPPATARLRCYWWWLNGHTDAATITHDLEQMAAMGYGGAILVDANGANQNGNDDVLAGPEFGSPAWTALYVHALKEAHRLGLEITLNITSGWNLGGPSVQPQDASKLLTWSRDIVAPGQAAPAQLSTPPVTNGFYRRIAVLAYPLHQGAALAGAPGSKRSALRGLRYKSAAAELPNFSMPDADWLLTTQTPNVVDADTDLPQVIDITNDLDTQGHLHWSPPAHSNTPWEILTLGYTDSDARVSTSSGAWQGLAIDYLDPRAFDLYWNTTVQPLLTAARPYVGSSLKYVATDSWELGGTNWTRAFRAEFIRRRGYDPVPWLPVVAGRIVNSRERSTLFLADLRRTVADLINTHYDRMAARARLYGLGIQCESGGPHGAPLDALETFRSSSIPQTEYWAMSKQHRKADSERYFVKESASAAHIYGRPFSAAEGMTSIGNHWSESIGMNLRPSFDQALTEGMNRLVWHEFTSSPSQLGLPGQEYFAGTHLNPNVTWWHVATPFFQYLNRSQFLMQQGLPVSDVLYYYGDNVPNFVRLKRDDPAKVLPGYDYDVTDTEALLQRLTFPGGILQTPEGIRYRALALPASRILPLTVLRWMQRYAEAGGTLIGQRPIRSQGIVSVSDDAQFQQLTNRMWTPCEASATQHVALGKGSLYCTTTAHEALMQMALPPDFEERHPAPLTLDYIHRTTPTAEIYFVRNTLPTAVKTVAVLRIASAQPTFFHADTGLTEDTVRFTPTNDGRTSIPLTLGPYDSVFVVLRHTTAPRYLTAVTRDGQPVPDLTANLPGTYQFTLSDGTNTTSRIAASQTLALTGPWTLSFPTGWGAPPQLQLSQLTSWTTSTDTGVRYFSGSATYHLTLQLTSAQATAFAHSTLDLGEVHEVAAVRINGISAGTLWKSPYRVTTAALLHEGENRIDIEVTNLWPNRIIGDAQPDVTHHYTWTNIRAYTKDSPLLPSGLLGPVNLQSNVPCESCPPIPAEGR